MIIRQIKANHWDQIYRHITTNGSSAPLSMQVDMKINCSGVDYILKVQPGSKRKVAILQAVSVCRSVGEPDGNHYHLIHDNTILSALFEIIVYQGQGIVKK